MTRLPTLQKGGHLSAFVEVASSPSQMLAYRSKFPAGLCYGCALASAVALHGHCPICRDRFASIVTFDDLHPRPAEPELTGVSSNAPPSQAPQALESPPSTAAAGHFATTATIDTAANTAASCSFDESQSTTAGGARHLRKCPRVERRRRWVAKVTGPLPNFLARYYVDCQPHEVAGTGTEDMSSVEAAEGGSSSERRPVVDASRFGKVSNRT